MRFAIPSWLAAHLLAACAMAQEPPPALRDVVRWHDVLVTHGPAFAAVWPGFRPDTIPAHYVVPHVGKVLLSWRDELPEGFHPYPGRVDAGWAGPKQVRLPSGRGIAFNNLRGDDPLDLVILAVHEAFHSYERASRRAGRRFGAWENAILTGTYPVFDVQNETAFAIEAAVLRLAAEAPDTAQVRVRAREFVALRRARRAGLDPRYASYEADAEINEGLAQYAQFTGLTLLADRGALPDARAARARVGGELALLDRILTADERSVRRRFYATGTALGLVLDRLTGEAWKRRLMRDTADLTTILSDAVGPGDGDAAAVRARAERRVHADALRRSAAEAVAALATRRAGQRDSLLGRPGVVLVLDASAVPGGWNWCGFDPQNLLQTEDGTLLHLSFLNGCAGNDVRATVQSGVVQEPAGRLLVHAGPVDGVRLFAGNVPAELPRTGDAVEVVGLRIEARGVVVEMPAATVRWGAERGRLEVIARPHPLSPSPR